MNQKWIQRAIETYRYHAQKLKENKHWRLSDTAKALRRSLGSISEDVLIAEWLKEHDAEIKRFKYCKDALSYIRERQQQLECDTSHLDNNA